MAIPKMKSRWFAVGAIAAMALTGCTATPPAPGAQAMAGHGRQCFNASTVNSFHAVNDQTVLVKVGVKHMYELQIVGTCPDIDWTQRLALRSRGGSPWVCQGLDAELIVPSPSGTQRCPVVGVRELSPAEVQAYRASRH